MEARGDLSGEENQTEGRRARDRRGWTRPFSSSAGSGAVRSAPDRQAGIQQRPRSHPGSAYLP